MNDIENKTLAEIRLVNASTFLLCLATEENITENTYNYLNDIILWVLHNIIRDNETE